MADAIECEDLGRPVRALIVDDEPLGRQLVRNLAAESPCIEIAGECASGGEALAAMKSSRPDAVFLDIKMPDVDGLAVARKVIDPDTLIVFVTAFEVHALEAFAVRAFDYLLKPIDKERFASVALRLHASTRRTRLERALAGRLPQMVEPHSSPVAAAPEKLRIRVRDGTRLQYVDADNVVWFEAANQYVRIHALSGTHLISSESLNSLQAKVDARKFMRLHRSAIVNVAFARSIRVGATGAYFLEMVNGDRVRVSRRNREALKNLDI